jgi:peptide deformylase
MATRTILNDSDPTLRKKSRVVDRFDDRLHQLIDDMKETLIEADGVGLAAPQVGVLRRVVIVDDGERMLELINPEIIEQEGEEEGPEGCLSSPGKYGMVCRPVWAKVRAQDRFGNFFEVEGEGIVARCFCHEIDHLNGVLFKDLVTRMIDPSEWEDDDDEDYTLPEGYEPPDR